MKFSSGCSAVRLAHLVWDQGAAGSNPATPTIKRPQAKPEVFFSVRVKLCLSEDTRMQEQRAIMNKLLDLHLKKITVKYVFTLADYTSSVTERPPML